MPPVTPIIHHHNPNNWNNRNFFQPVYVVQEPQPSYIITNTTAESNNSLSDKQFKTIVIGLISLAVIIIIISAITR